MMMLRIVTSVLGFCIRWLRWRGHCKYGTVLEQLTRGNTWGAWFSPAAELAALSVAESSEMQKNHTVLTRIMHIAVIQSGVFC